MRIVTELPRRVHETEHLWIPLSDGCRLSARLWIPEGAEENPVPVILESIPYGKRWGTRQRDEPMHRYLAGHGYGCVRVDVRGTGESEGILHDEYSDKEQTDTLEVLRWLAQQTWCTGRVGMLGKSWGGFAALQAAAHRPEELGAVIAVCASDDRYTDDAHYMGGCLLNENLVWGSMLQAVTSQPPDPDLVGETWKRVWMERLRAVRLFPEVWMRHPLCDDYWRQGSVREVASSIACPVLLVSGWMDGYSNAVPRLLSSLGGETRAIVGPWAHLYPHQGVPGPAVGFLQEALRFFDRWLKGLSDDRPPEPAYRAWMLEGVVPSTFHDERPGRWVAEPVWPAPGIEPRVLFLGGGRLVKKRARERELTHRSPQSTGLFAGGWCGFGARGEMPPDQRADDGKSLVFDSESLSERVEILGGPELHLVVSVNRPRAFVVARLNDVFPDGTSARVTFGILDLAHARGHDSGRSLVPGQPVEVRIRLNDVGYSFAPGHRLRLALSTAYWPMVWPSPEEVTLRVVTGRSRIELPVRSPRNDDAHLRTFDGPEAGRPARVTELSPSSSTRRMERDLSSPELVLQVLTDVGDDGEPGRERLEDIDLEAGHSVVETYRIHDDDPLSARAEVTHRILLRRDGWSATIESAIRLEADREEFHLEAELKASEGETRIEERGWDVKIPRFHS